MNEILTYLLGQATTLLGLAVTAWIFGWAFSRGVSRELKKSVPHWIKNYTQQTREARAIAQARDKMDEYNVK